MIICVAAKYMSVPHKRGLSTVPKQERAKNRPELNLVWPGQKNQTKLCHVVGEKLMSDWS